MNKKIFGVDVSLGNNTLSDVKINPLTTLQMNDYASTLTFEDAGILVYNTDENRFYAWNGTGFSYDEESDPTVAQHIKDISQTQISDWDDAHSWGDHSVVGYLTSFTETDPTVPSHVKGITSNQVSNWDTAYGWGNHAFQGYLTTETDPTVPSHVKGITTTNISNWNTAHGWGNHATQGYLKVEADPVFTASQASSITQAHITKLNRRSITRVATYKVVSAAPVPAEADTYYTVGNSSSIVVNISDLGTLATGDIIRVSAKVVIASTGSPSGGQFIRFNSDSANNYGASTNFRTGYTESPAGQIRFYNSTQLSEVYDLDFVIRTEFNNNPGAGIVAGYKTLVGQVFSRGFGFGSVITTGLAGIWRNSSNNITTITFGTNALQYAVGTEIVIYREV